MGDNAYYEIKLLFLKLCEDEGCFVLSIMLLSLELKHVVYYIAYLNVIILHLCGYIIIL